MRPTFVSWILGLAGAFGALGAAHAGDCTPMATERIADGFDSPLLALSPPGDTGRLFVVEKDGRIRIIELANNAIRPAAFLDIDPLVGSSGEAGLLGLAFHPDYVRNRYFYVHYNDNDGDTVIARYRTMESDPDRADPASAKIIFTHPQPAWNHNGGMIAFGPNDGYLYIALGDGGGSSSTSRNRQSYLGKMLRIDVDVDPERYLIPASNPFVDDPGTLDEIWSLGLRNPWRFSFDSANGDLYIGDVGAVFREEINYAPGTSVGGEDWGWNCMEGLLCTGVGGCTCFAPELARPIIEHPRTEARCIVGGWVYRGRAIPSLQGVYLYADARTDRVYSLRVVDGQATDFRDRTDDLQPLGKPLDNMVSLGQDGAGELYIVSLFGEIYRVVPDGLAHGDMNGDGAVDAFDIEPFVIALTDRNTYIAMYPNIDPDETGDTNCDGVMDTFDIEGFIGYLY